MQGACRHPVRVILGHRFNPPYVIPLVEVVDGSRLQRTRCSERWRSTRRSANGPSIGARGDGPHFEPDRGRAIARGVSPGRPGVASVADIDTAISHGPGLRWTLIDHS
ncbi:3-hydroxyacyl-CoA dehydrogenase NAD-binding domain-containing protein [Massilia niastensis]|uniref:3-hydroxyacyl-CoA dehydrogenase NAD-binding domain-containing protein n=1 Tax=Massilia niastensis TaxID=544911 RepID=UPI003530B4FD